jgi:alginate O-acetyltransferase complex protein AlgI
MLFNSIDFAIFLPIVFLLYWFVFNKNLRVQNFFLVVASYVFYGWWDWRFLSLLLFSSLVDYLVGMRLLKEDAPAKRKFWLWVSICVNLGFLGFFKYYNFFADNFVAAFTFFGQEINAGTLNIVLPVGISFYTLQTLSYSIDVYRKKLEPTKDFIAFLAFVSFFPQLVAGPIERATNLLPQFFHKRKFEYAHGADGMRQILWGLFKKVVLADNCGRFADMVYNNYDTSSGLVLVVGAFLYTIQIYGDFAGYSDIAIGTSRLFGFNLMRNFAYPNFARDPAEFWRRWHISLSTWFRDYLYIPLGGSKGNTWKRVRNTFAIFLVSAFWHGANWTFLIWGFLNAVYFLPLLLAKKNRINLDIVAAGKMFPSAKDFFKMLLTFVLIAFSRIFFRSPTVTIAFEYIKGMFAGPFFTGVFMPKGANTFQFFLCFLFIGILFLVEWLQREKPHALYIPNLNKFFRWSIYVFFIALIVFFGVSERGFVYFQF